MSRKPIRKLLIANRGEIAVRIIRAARALGIKTVAVLSDADMGVLHARLADEKILLGGVRAADTYLNAEKLIQAAVSSGADAIHPGYGFLSENSNFAKMVESAGLNFVGPAAAVMALMGDKGQARAKAKELGVALIPGSAPGMPVKDLKKFAAQIGYPVIFKASAGGSGRGMRVVRSENELEEKHNEASSEALAAFGNGEVFLEKFLENPRHIEVQVFGDSHGNYLHFFERECSVQRRHQKLIEEAPACRLHPDVRARLHKDALTLARAVKYENSGTVEFLVEGGEQANSPHYFLEMNTRIQVEHPVTEIVTGVDLLQLQLKVAGGEPIGFSQSDLSARGHAIEFRIYAESPEKNFAPTSGEIRYISRPGGPGIREDSWVEAGTKISPYYDALLSKIIVSANSREEAINRARAVLDEYVLEGIENTLGFHRWILTQPIFCKGLVDVYWINREYHGETSSRRRGVGPVSLPPPYEHKST